MSTSSRCRVSLWCCTRAITSTGTTSALRARSRRRAAASAPLHGTRSCWRSTCCSAWPPSGSSRATAATLRSAWALSLLLLVTIPVAPFSLQVLPGGRGRADSGRAVPRAVVRIQSRRRLCRRPWTARRVPALAAPAISAARRHCRSRPRVAAQAASREPRGVLDRLRDVVRAAGTLLAPRDGQRVADRHLRLEQPRTGRSVWPAQRRRRPAPGSPIRRAAVRPGVLRGRRGPAAVPRGALAGRAWILALASSILVAVSASHVPWTGAASPARFLVAVMPFALPPACARDRPHAREPLVPCHPRPARRQSRSTTLSSTCRTWPIGTW